MLSCRGKKIRTVITLYLKYNNDKNKNPTVKTKEIIITFLVKILFFTWSNLFILPENKSSEDKLFLEKLFSLPIFKNLFFFLFYNIFPRHCQ